MIGGRNGEQVRHRPAVTATGLAEPKRAAGSGAVGVTRAEAPVTAGHAGPAGDLERHEHPIADPALADVVADGDHLGHRLVSDRERPGEDAERRHRLVEVTARDRERTHQRAA